MPYVNIKVTDDNVTVEQKRQLIQGTTQLLVDILNKNPGASKGKLSPNCESDNQLTGEQNSP